MSRVQSDLDVLFNPKSVAIIGASNRPESISGQFLHYLTRHKFAGSIYPVNPRHKEISGFRCYGSITEAPGRVDLAICVVPGESVADVVSECAAKGVGWLMIPSTGFAEASAEGEQLQSRLLEIARSKGMRLLGPNCMGFINFKKEVVASFGAFLEKPRDLTAGNIGFVSQSGAFGARVVRRCLSRGVGLTYEVSTGNEADIQSLDFIEYMIEDAETKVIGAFIESVKSGRRLLELGWRAQELGKILVVLKAGRSQVGLAAVSSHTGRLSSSAQIYRGIFRQGGILEVRTFNELCLALEAFALLERSPKEIRLAIVVGSGGNGVMMVDQAEELGVAVSELSPATQKQIAALIPEAGSCRNPVDVTAQVTHNQPEKLTKVVELLAQQDSVTAIIVGVNHLCLTRCWADLLQIAVKHDKLLGITMSGDVSQEIRDGLRQSRRVLLVDEAEELLWMLKAIGDQSKLQVGGSKEIALSESAEEAYRLASPAGGELTEYDVKRLLSPHISVPQGELARSSEQAVEISERFGYPVALKLAAPGLRHKTESGMVRLNVGGPEEVAGVFEEFIAKQGSRNGKTGVLVEQMVPQGVEVIVGFLRSNELGPIVMFGSGGVLVELVRDTTYRSLPLTRAEAERMGQECLCYKLMKGFRNQAEKDLGALIDAILSASRVFMATPWIREMEFNPIAVLDRGEGVRVLDALIVAQHER